MNHTFSRLKLPAIVLTLFCIPLSFSPSHKNSLHLFGTSAYAEDDPDDGSGDDNQEGDVGGWEEEDDGDYGGGACGASSNPGLQDNMILKSKLCIKGTTVTYTQGPNGPIASVSFTYGRRNKCFAKQNKKCDDSKEHECQ